MHYRVQVTSVAERDIVEAYRWLEQRSTSAATKWLTAIEEAIASLATMPERCPVIPEAGEIGHSARHLLLGRRRHVYRVIFDIVAADQPEALVRVLRVWRGGRPGLMNLDEDLQE